MRLLPVGSVGWCRAAAETAGAYARTSDAVALERLAGELLAVPADRRSPGAYPTTLARAANYLRYGGRVETASRLMDAAEAAGASSASPRARAWLHMLRGVDGLFRGDLGAYIVHERGAKEAFEEAGAQRRAANEAVNVGFALMELGAWDEAERTLREAMEWAERLGLTDLVAVASQNLGRALGHLGEVEEAARLEQAAAEAFAERGDLRMEGGSRVYLAAILLDAGRFDEAADEARRAGERLAGVATLAPWAEATLARALLARGSTEEALARARAALTTLEEVGQLEAGEAVVRLTFAEALLASGDATGAARAAAGAAQRLRVRADKIADAALRESFLARVPENARTLALAAELGGDSPP
jgi:tetratricopeptide (TPR) repeat protein